MDNPSPDSPQRPDRDPDGRIWSQPPARPTGPADTPFDPSLHNLVHDLDHAWDLPIPYALSGAPRGVQPRVEFTTSGAFHPSTRRFFADGYLAFVVHSMAVTEQMVCGCDSCGRPGKAEFVAERRRLAHHA